MNASTTVFVSRRAFSLLELTLVLLIIGLLGAVAATNLVGAGERARVRQTKASMTQFKSQIQMYALDNGAVPGNLADLVTAEYAEPDNNGNPRNDAWKRPFYFKPTPDNAHEFDLISAGKDGELNTPDDINLWDPSFDN